ncbi:MAG: insulinase family protein [Flavobacteriaceae bacterium]|nr:insulinase family protein [Flavobacteriaceae bacterium]
MKNIKYIAAAFLFSGMVYAQNIDINAMPKPGPTPAINIAKPNSFKLKNGLTVLVVENNKLPRVNIQLTMDRPPIYEGNIVGVGEIMADQLGTGTTKLSKEEFNKKIDFLGARLSFYPQGAGANTLSKYSTQVISLMADAVVNPKFSAEEVSKSKERTIEGLKTKEKDAGEIARRVDNALTYGKNTALGEFVTEESINRIQLKDVQDFYKKYYAPDNAYLVIVGDVKTSEIKKLVEKEFGKWKKSGTKFAAIEPAKNLPATEINIVDVPTAVQSVIHVGNPTTLQMKDPQYFSGVIANHILGGAETRLFMNLREKNGYTYGAYSHLSTSKYSPYFSANASVRNEVTDKAVVEFMNELKGISQIKPEELANAKAKLKGEFIMSLEKPETIARFALNERLYSLPADFYANYLKSIDKVTTSDVSAAAKANILPNQSRIFVAGKGSEIADGLEKLGYPVKYFDKFANPASKPETKKIAAGVTAESIGQKYIAAIGGKANVEKINSLQMNASATTQGMTIETAILYAKGGKTSVEMKMMGQTIQKIVFDGKDGYMMVQGQKQPLPAELKEKLSANKEIFPELDFNAKNTTLRGIENINGEDAYAVKKGNKTYFYSVKTGLKTGESETQNMQGQEIIVPTYYSDYKEVSGVKSPFKISQNMGGIEMNFEVKSYEINKATDKDFK